MKEKSLVFAVIIGIVLSGCGASKKQLDIAKRMQESIKANGCLITTGTLPNHSKGNQKIIKLSFNGVNSNSLDDRFTSTGALFFYQNDTPEIYKYDQIIINLAGGSTSFQKVYTLEDIKTSESLYKFPVSSFFKYYATDSIKYILDDRFPDSATHQIVNFMQSIDSTYGKIDNLGFAGWATSFIRETHEPLKVYYVTAINGKYMTDYLISVSPGNKKIANISILNKPHR